MGVTPLESAVMARDFPRRPAKSGRQLNLPALRHRSGVSLDQIAERTKISRRFLQAIEAEDFQTLPGGVFNTSYIRQYAAAIGYNEEELLAFYRERTGEPEPEALPARKPADSAKSATLRWLRAASFLRLF